MIRIGIDDRKEMQKKLRAFSKADYKYYETEDLERFKPLKNEEEKPSEVVKKKEEESDESKVCVIQGCSWSKKK